MDNIITALKSEISSHGMVPPDQIEPGKMIRFSDNGQKNKNGWCIFFENPDGSAGAAFGSWRGINKKWFYKPDGAPLSMEQQQAFIEKIEQARKKADQERKAKQADAAKMAKEIWDKSKPASQDHPYLKAKNIKPYIARQDKNTLLLPGYDEKGLCTLQRIWLDQSNKFIKLFLKESKSKNCFNVIGDIENSDTYYLGEGYATMASIHEATGEPCVVAFSSGNLKGVATYFKEKYPEKKIIITSDNDLETQKKTGINPGRKAAEEAASTICADLCICPIDSDFNDLQQAHGMNAVLQALQKTRTINIIENAIEDSKTDPGAMYEPDILEALQEIQNCSPADYARYRAKFKEASSKNSVTQLDKLISVSGEAANDSKADELVELLRAKGTFFHNQDRAAFVSFERDGHTEIWSLQSTGFEDWAGYTFFKDQGKTAGESTLKTATGSLSGLAKFDGEKHDTFLRVAQYEDGYVIDLCNDNWSVVHIQTDGWNVLSNSPVKFWRTETMREIPGPAKNGVHGVAGVCQKTTQIFDGKKGVLDTLWKHLNVSEQDRILLLAWMLEAFRPETPFVIAEFIGGQGTAKSTTQSNVRDLIDPNAVNLRAAPKTPADIFVGAGSNWIASYNNLSHISAPMQDAYCILATGGGFAGRKLYTNFDEALLETKRPVMFNGISSLATNQDLIDRTVRIDLPEISEYKEESVLRNEFLEDKPKIMGGLFDLFSKTLKRLPDIKIVKPPRMADFARLGEAMSQVMGNKPDTFVTLYNEARQQAIINALDGSPVALAIQDLLDKFVRLDNVLMKDALERLSEYRPYGEAWPKSPRGLGDILRRNKPGLKAIGINVIIHNRDKKGVHVTIKRVPLFPEKNNMENQCTPHTPHTPIVEKRGSQAPVNGEEGVHGVLGVCQNSTQIFPGEKGIPENESTPDEVII